MTLIVVNSAPDAKVKTRLIYWSHIEDLKLNCYRDMRRS